MNQTILDQIVGSIADVEEVDLMDLDVSIQNCVSTDSIRNLVNHGSNAWRLQFETPNHVVEVTGNDKILVDGTQIRQIPDY